MRIKNIRSKYLTRRTPEEVQTLVHEYRKSGLTQREYAQQVGVALSTVARWVRGGSTRPHARRSKPKFVEVEMSAAHPVGSDGVYQIDLPGGVRLRAEGAWQPERMQQLLSILQRS